VAKKMTDQLDPETPEQKAVQSWGLIVRGRVERRIRRHIGENQTEVITYTLGPRMVMVEEWEPKDYFEIGEMLELPVETGVYAGLVNLRISREQEF